MSQASNICKFCNRWFENQYNLIQHVIGHLEFQINARDTDNLIKLIEFINAENLNVCAHRNYESMMSRITHNSKPDVLNYFSTTGKAVLSLIRSPQSPQQPPTQQPTASIDNLYNNYDNYVNNLSAEIDFPAPADLDLEAALSDIGCGSSNAFPDMFNDLKFAPLPTQSASIAPVANAAPPPPSPTNDAPPPLVEAVARTSVRTLPSRRLFGGVKKFLITTNIVIQERVVYNTRTGINTATRTIRKSINKSEK